MSTAAIIGIAILVAAGLTLVLWDFFRDLLMFVDPEEAMKRNLRRRHGEGSPEYQAAIARLGGPGSDRRILLSLTGLAGIAVTAWILFGGAS